MTIPDWLRPVLARVIAAVLASGISYLARKGIDLGLTEQQQQAFTEGLLAVMAGVWGIAYAGIHKAISAKTNPTDSASPAIAAAATGPLGSGEREALGRKLDQAAQPVPPQPRIHDNIEIPRPEMRREEVQTPPPAYEPLMQSPIADGFGETFQRPEPVKKKRIRKRPAQTPPQPGAPQPDVAPTEPTEGFEP